MSTKNNRLAVLNLEWTSYPSRDREMVALVGNYLRYQGYSFLEDTVFNGYHLLNKFKPKLFFITNSIGAIININLMKYSRKKNILGASLISEGNFKDNIEYLDQSFFQSLQIYRLRTRQNQHPGIRVNLFTS